MIHTARQSAKFIKLVRMIRGQFPSLPISHETVAIGILERLWHFAINSAKRGDIGQHDDELIAEACGWFDEPSVLIEMLLTSGWIDTDDTHRLVIHDWDQHAPSFVKRNIERCGGWAKCSIPAPKFPINDAKPPLNCSSEQGSGHLTAQDDAQAATPNQTKPNLTQPNPTGELRSWGGVEKVLIEVGIGRREKVLAHLRSCGSEPFKVEQIVGVWQSRQRSFTNPLGALFERLMNEAPGMAADTGWVAPPPRDTGQRRARDQTTEFEMQRAHVVKQLRSEGKSEDEIDQAVAMIAKRMQVK